MGNFRVEINAVGGHGCDRKAKEGEPLYGHCGRHGCVDCDIVDLILRWKLKNTAMINSVTFTHWPGETSEVVDDLLNNKRLKGEFKN